MKISYIFAVLAIVILVGCAQETVAPVATPPPVAETPPPIVEEAPPAEVPAEIEILVKGFDPEEITVKKGTTVKWINTAPSVKMLTSAVNSGRLESGDTFEFTFEEVGEFRVFDLFGKKWLTITVVEEMPVE